MLLQIYKSDSVGQKFCETRNHSKVLDQVENALNDFVAAASGDGGQMSGEHPQVRVLQFRRRRQRQDEKHLERVGLAQQGLELPAHPRQEPERERDFGVGLKLGDVVHGQLLDLRVEDVEAALLQPEALHLGRMRHQRLAVVVDFQLVIVARDFLFNLKKKQLR